MEAIKKKNKVRVKRQPDGTYCHVYPMAHDEQTLFFFFRDVFAEHWRDIRFGPMLEGATWEMSAPCLPERIDLNDGYLTIDFGTLNFHLCIGGPKGSSNPQYSQQHQKKQCTAQAEFFRLLTQDRSSATGWGFRCFNGLGQQQITIHFPSPFYSLKPTYQKLDPPDWSRLEVWNSLRKRFLEQPPESIDKRAIDIHS